MTSIEEKVVDLVSKEEDSFSVPLSVACLSQLVKSVVDDNDEDDNDDNDDNTDNGNNKDPIVIPLPNVKSNVLQKVIQFCNYYVKEEPMAKIEKPLKSQDMGKVVQSWYANFVTNLEHVMLFELIVAANYMDIKPLLELTTARAATMLSGKTPDEIRSIFKIQKDFTREEEEQIRQENKWCEEF